MTRPLQDLCPPWLSLLPSPDYYIDAAQITAASGDLRHPMPKL